MNQTINAQLNHRSIRKYTDQKVSPEILKTLFQVANQTATSTGAQSFSIIHLTDPLIKQKLSEICKQPYVADATEIVIFIADAYRNAKIVEAQGCTHNGKKDMDRFFQAFTDGTLAAQNMMTAIESLSLGAVFLGSILNNAEEVIRLLNLPELTFPIVGIAFGYPAEEPALKPRMDVNLKVFENSYQVQANYLEAIADYDQTMRQYYDLRDATKALPAFSKQLVKRLENTNPMRTTLLQTLQKQGFNLNVNSTISEEN